MTMNSLQLLYCCFIRSRCSFISIGTSKVQLVPKFKEFDTDDNGYITVEEASHILQNHPYNFPPTKVTVLLKRFDRDGNGKLDIEEFAGFYAEAKAT